MTRLKMLSLGALLGAAALSFAATTPVPQPATTMHADSGCPECFPPPPLCNPDETCPDK